MKRFVISMVFLCLGATHFSNLLGEELMDTVVAVENAKDVSKPR